MGAATGRRELLAAVGAAGMGFGVLLQLVARVLVPILWSPGTNRALRLYLVAKCCPLAYSAQVSSLLWLLVPLLLTDRLIAAHRAAAPGAESWADVAGLRRRQARWSEAQALAAAAVVVTMGVLAYTFYLKPHVIDHGRLVAAATRGQVDRLRELLDRGLDPNAADVRGVTVLHEAVCYGERDAARVLLEAGADPNRASAVTHATPLHWAVDEGASQIAELLLEGGADPNAKARARFLLGASVGSGITPLHVAANEDDTGSIRALIRHGARLDEPTSRGITPLEVAVTGGSDRAADLLVQRGAEVNAVDHDGFTALHLAASYDELGIAQTLLAHGADVRVGVGGCGTPLHYAAWRATAAMVRLLLEHGTPVDATDDRNRTALYVAAAYGNLDSIGPLLEAKADPTIRAANGRTPLEAAVHYEELAAAQLLREHGAD